MALSEEESRTISVWHSANGIAYNTQRLAEIQSIMHIAGFLYDSEQLDKFLTKMVSHHELRQWLLAQLPERPGLMPHFDIHKEYDLPSKLAEYGDKTSRIRNSNLMREIGIQLEQDGYRLIKL